MVSMAFVGKEKWTRRYQRNNKHNGLKNLRCFPYCGELHLKNKFCGRPIEVCFQLDGSVGIEELEFHGEFHLASEETALQKQPLIKQSDVKQLERRKSNLKQPLYTGQVSSNMDNCMIRVLFNRQEEGWHYGWLSSKHTTHLEHVFRVYLHQKHGDCLQLLATAASPTFTMFCRRRNRKESPAKPLPNKRRNVIDIETMVWKILEAVLRLEQDEKRKLHLLKEQPTKPESQDLSYSFNKVEIAEPVDTQTLSDFLDMVLPEISNDHIDVPELISHTPLTCSSSFLNKFALSTAKPRVARKEILKKLGFHLLEKTMWTSVYEKHGSDSFEVRKKSMIEVLAVEISKFLAEWSYTIETFIRFLDNTDNEIDLTGSSVFTENLSSDCCKLLENEPPCPLSTAQKLQILVEIERIMTGIWLNDKRTEDIFEMLREDIGYPWMLRKLVSQNSKTYSFHFENANLQGLERGEVVLVCGFGKGLGLLSSGIKIAMNGEDCETSIVTPLPPFLKAKIIPVNKGFIDFNTKRLFWFSTYGTTNRIVTVQNFRNNERHVQLVYQTRSNDKDSWKTKSCTSHKPARIQ